MECCGAGRVAIVGCGVHMPAVRSCVRIASNGLQVTYSEYRMESNGLQVTDSEKRIASHG